MLDPRRQLDLDLPKRIHTSHCLLTVRPVNGRRFFLCFLFLHFFCYCDYGCDTPFDHTFALQSRSCIPYPSNVDSHTT